MLFTILVVVQVLVAISLVALILVQHGKGADAGAAFGSGASGTVFGAQGAANFLSRATAALATVFFAVSLTLAYLVGGNTGGGESVTQQIEEPGSELLDEQKSQQGDTSEQSQSSQESGPSPESLPE